MPPWDLCLGEDFYEPLHASTHIIVFFEANSGGTGSHVTSV